MFRILERFPDEQSCITFLEKIRWGNEAACPLCGSTAVAPKRDGRRVGRWNCHDCRSSFTVCSGTLFEKTRIPPAEVVLRHRSDDRRQEKRLKLPVGPKP